MSLTVSLTVYPHSIRRLSFGVAAALGVLVFCAITPAPIHAAPPDSLDAFWNAVSQTVANGDFEGYAALYHDDAVLVNGISGESQPIGEALAGWKSGFEATAAGRVDASVTFRFTRRIHDDSTAHETGLFRYLEQPQGETAAPTYVHFEALLVRTANGWKMLMEHQTSIATEAEWTAAGEG